MDAAQEVMQILANRVLVHLDVAMSVSKVVRPHEHEVVEERARHIRVVIEEIPQFALMLKEKHGVDSPSSISTAFFAMAKVIDEAVTSAKAATK